MRRRCASVCCEEPLQGRAQRSGNISRIQSRHSTSTPEPPLEVEVHLQRSCYEPLASSPPSSGVTMKAGQRGPPPRQRDGRRPRPTAGQQRAAWRLKGRLHFGAAEVCVSSSCRKNPHTCSSDSARLPRQPIASEDSGLGMIVQDVAVCTAEQKKQKKQLKINVFSTLAKRKPS